MLMLQRLRWFGATDKGLHKRGREKADVSRAALLFMINLANQ